MTSNTERLVGDIDCTTADFDCTMADSNCTMVDDTQGTLIEFSSHSSTQEQPPVIKKQRSQRLTFYWDQRRILEEGQ